MGACAGTGVTLVPGLSPQHSYGYFYLNDEEDYGGGVKRSIVQGDDG